MAFLLLWRWMALSSRSFDSKIRVALPDWSQPSGIVMMAVGGVVICWCAGVFVTFGRGTPAPFDPPRKFVATGPYRFVRNPMYIGGLILLVGFGLWQRSFSMLFFSVLAALIVHLFVVLVEEPNLEQRFGGSYLEYKRNVNRWLPARPVNTDQM
jgi:protein-S-isoprenylcysteine O-methyltransferase Ste14